MRSEFVLAIALIAQVLVGCERSTTTPSGGRSIPGQKQAAVNNVITDACTTSPLLAKYTRGEFLSRPESGLILMKLTADLHSLDCGAPDCYGTHLDVQLHVSPQSAQCWLQSAVVHAENFYCPDMKPHLSAENLRIRTSRYLFKSQSIDLSNPALMKLVLRGENSQEALVLLRDDLYYFEEVTPGGTLHTRLPGDEDNEKSCCWGASSSELLRMGTE